MVEGGTSGGGEGEYFQEEGFSHGDAEFKLGRSSCLKIQVK